MARSKSTKHTRCGAPIISRSSKYYLVTLTVNKFVVHSKVLPAQNCVMAYTAYLHAPYTYSSFTDLIMTLFDVA